jgi:hypothetical protein
VLEARLYAGCGEIEMWCGPGGKTAGPVTEICGRYLELLQRLAGECELQIGGWLFFCTDGISGPPCTVDSKCVC